jgi:hypothetical protein
MSAKSRGNWKMGICLKSDCTNRDKLCTECLRFDKYAGTNPPQPVTSVKDKKLNVSIYPMPLEEYCERGWNAKSGKGSWQRGHNPNGPGLCAKGDCINRHKKCRECFKSDMYDKGETYGL